MYLVPRISMNVICTLSTSFVEAKKTNKVLDFWMIGTKLLTKFKKSHFQTMKSGKQNSTCMNGGLIKKKMLCRNPLWNITRLYKMYCGPFKIPYQTILQLKILVLLSHLHLHPHHHHHPHHPHRHHHHPHHQLLLLLLHHLHQNLNLKDLKHLHHHNLNLKDLDHLNQKLHKNNIKVNLKINTTRSDENKNNEKENKNNAKQMKKNVKEKKKNETRSMNDN